MQFQVFFDDYYGVVFEVVYVLFLLLFVFIDGDGQGVVCLKLGVQCYCCFVDVEDIEFVQFGDFGEVGVVGEQFGFCFVGELNQFVVGGGQVGVVLVFDLQGLQFVQFFKDVQVVFVVCVFVGVGIV